jgi:hypothetical protein
MRVCGQRRVFVAKNFRRLIAPQDIFQIQWIGCGRESGMRSVQRDLATRRAYDDTAECAANVARSGRTKIKSRSHHRQISFQTLRAFAWGRSEFNAAREIAESVSNLVGLLRECVCCVA